MQEQIYDMLLKESEVTWQDILQRLVKEEQMDPWDVDLTKLTQKYIETVKKMKEMDYFISGKVLLASALLLRIKSQRFLEEDMSNFDAFLFHHKQEEFQELGEFLPYQQEKVEIPKLGIRTPLMRKRKVSIADLIHALERALHVDTRRKLRLQRFLTFHRPEIPEKKIDIHLLIDAVYQKLLGLFQQKQVISFSEVDPGKGKEETILTLLPLLYLHGSKKITIDQEEAFGEIAIHHGTVAG